MAILFQVLLLITVLSFIVIFIAILGHGKRYIPTLLFFVLVVIYSFIHSSKASWMGRIYHYLFDILPSVFKNSLKQVIGCKNYDTLQDGMMYLFYEPNPAFQVGFYKFSLENSYMII